MTVKISEENHGYLTMRNRPVMEAAVFNCWKDTINAK